MMGTGPFAVPTFEKLLASEHGIAALVTRPPRGRKPAPSPMRVIATAAGLPIFEPESINATESLELLRTLAADLFVVCDYGQILSRVALGTSRLGGINLHASLLPRYRGAAPINWAIYNGDTETGVTVIHMTPALDGGPCLVQVATPLGSNETAPQVEQRLAVVGVDAVLQAIDLLQQQGNHPPGGMQDQALATRAPRLTKFQGLIDWGRSARELHNQVRAFQPWPASYTFCPLPGGVQRLILEQTRVAASDNAATAHPPGTVIEAADGRLIVACGAGALQILRVQPAGKRPMPTEEFLRGNHLPSGLAFTNHE